VPSVNTAGPSRVSAEGGVLALRRWNLYGGRPFTILLARTSGRQQEVLLQRPIVGEKEPVL